VQVVDFRESLVDISEVSHASPETTTAALGWAAESMNGA